MTGTDDYTVKTLDETTWPAFAARIEANDGIWGGCWCMSFHAEGIGKNTTAELNQQRKHQRVLDGQAHAALVFAGNDCIGWCQFGPPDELPKIKNRGEYNKSLTTLPDWRIACCYVDKAHRRNGASAIALQGALDLIAKHGGGIVEGYPEDESTTVAFTTNGLLHTYESLGFSRDRQIGKRRWVVRISVDSTQDK